MKKIVNLIICFLVCLSVNAQTKDDEVKRLNEINQQIILHYRKNNLKKAQDFAEQSVDITTKLFGSNSTEAALAYKNLGNILKERKKYRESAVKLQNALEIFQKNSASNSKDLAKTMESLGTVLAVIKQKKKAETLFLESINLIKNKFGEKSSEIIPFLTSATYFFIYVREFEKAHNLFVQRYLVTKKLYGKDSEKLGKINDEYFCFAQSVNKKKEINTKKFSEDVGKKGGKPKRISGGVINGKAISLVKPEYPPAARSVRLTGIVRIRVYINKMGLVTSARPLCGGHPVLVKASIESALRSKFQPTVLEGKPVEVSGVLVYTFRP